MISTVPKMRIIVAAGFLYGIAYLYPCTCWWGVWLSTVLLCMRMPFSGTHSFMWGLVAYGMQLHGLIPGMHALAPTIGWYAWIPALFLILYLAFATTIIWRFGFWSESFFHQPWRSAVRVCWLWGYWLFITYGSLFFCGRWEGYLLANPLIPCTTHSLFLCVIAYVGVGGATLLFCMVCACIAYALLYKKYCIVIGIMICCMLMSYAYEHLLHHESSDVCAHVGIVQESITSCVDDESICKVLAEHVACVYARNPALAAVLFPESSVYPWKICAESALAAYMPTKKQCDYIIGSFYQEGEYFRNSCYWLRNGVVQKRFDKRHAMPLIERLPWFLRCNFCKQLFFSAMPEVVPSCNERPILFMGDVACVPYICSELFFNRVPDDDYLDLPVVALVNDRWAPPYLQQLMYCGAIMQAHAWHRTVVYASYTRYIVINP